MEPTGSDLHARGKGLLADANAHPLDDTIVFVEETHRYFAKGPPTHWLPDEIKAPQLVPTVASLEGDAADPAPEDAFYRISKSVSAIWADLFKKNEFDSEGTLNKYFDRWAKDPENKYHQLIQYMDLVGGLSPGESKAQIGLMWQRNGERAADRGTHMHLQFEMYHNNEPYDKALEELPQFEVFFKRDRPTCKPYRTEWSIMDRAAWIAGQIDLLCKDSETGEFVMVDYKRAKNPMSPNMPNYSRFAMAPFSDVPDTQYHHYVMQQNFNAAILKRNYDIEVKKMYLLQRYEDRPYELVEVPDMVDRASAHLDALAAVRRNF